MLRRTLLAQIAMEEEALPPIEMLRDVMEQIPRAGAELAYAAGYDADPQVRSHARLMLMLGMKMPGVPEPVKEALIRDSGPVLEETVRDPRIEDEEKLLLGAAYMMGGGEMPMEEYEGYFKDFAGAMGRAANSVAEHLSDEPGAVEETLRALDMAGDEGREPLTVEDAERAMGASASFAGKDAAAAAALVCTTAALAAAAGLPLEGLVEPMDELAAHPHERAAWYLAELGRFPGMDIAGRKAAELAQAMKAGGVMPRLSLLKTFSHGYVSMVDGVGSRSVTLFFRTPEGGMDGLVLIVNDEVGMKDAWCMFDDSSEMEDAIRGQMGELAFAPCTVELARELVADAWAIQRETGRAFPGKFMSLRAYLGERAIEPKRREPNLGAYMLELMVPSEALARRSDDLADYGPYGGLWFAGDQAYRFIEANMGKGRRLKKELMQRFIKDVTILERDSVLSRMALNLEMESLAGRATQEINQIAAQTYLAMKENAVAWERVPYVRALAETSVQRIMESLREGFGNQRDANRAGMEMDQELMQMLDKLMGKWDVK